MGILDVEGYLPGRGGISSWSWRMGIYVVEDRLSDVEDGHHFRRKQAESG